MWKLQPPPEKSRPLFPSNPPLKVEVLSSPSPLSKFGWRLNPLPLQKGWVHTMITWDAKDALVLKQNYLTRVILDAPNFFSRKFRET